MHTARLTSTPDPYRCSVLHALRFAEQEATRTLHTQTPPPTLTAAAHFTLSCAGVHACAGCRRANAYR